MNRAQAAKQMLAIGVDLSKRTLLLIKRDKQCQAQMKKLAKLYKFLK